MNVKVNIVRSLKDKGETKIILQLMRVEKDPTFQRVAGELYRAELDRMLPQLLAKRDFDAVEQVLTQNAVQDATMQRLAAFWVVRGKAEDQAVKMREGLEKREDPVVRRQFIWLLRAKGDLAGAASAAEKLTDKELALSLAMESRDWKTAAKIEQEMVGPFDPPLPELAPDHRVATSRRQPGRSRQSRRGHQQAGEGSLSDVWLAAKGLLLNERANDGIDLLRKDLPDVAFRLLAYRSNFDGR